MIEVEVVYATPKQQVIITVSVLPNSTVEDVIHASGILRQFPEIQLELQKVGIFSKIVDLQHRVKPHDRIEIYRPLIIDPKDARKKRVKK